MTILPKKKEGEQSDSDSEGSGEASPSPPTRPPPPPGGPTRSPENAGGPFLPTSEGYYHRHYEYSSSGESSPELPVLSKHPPPLHPPHTSHSSPPSGVTPTTARERGDSEPGTPPYYSGYNSAEEYETSRAPFFDLELEREFEQALKKSRGMVIHRMKPDGACLFRAVDPINIFFGMYKTDNAPIRLSYHYGVHYNSVVDPYTATVGVGLGLAGHKPGMADKMLMKGALQESETFHLEQALLQDHLQSSDRDTTYEALEEAVARESYLTWLREQEMRNRSSQHGLESTSAACVSGSVASTHHPLPPPLNTLSTPSPPHSSHFHPHTLTPSSPLPHSPPSSSSKQKLAATGGKTNENKLQSKTNTSLHTSSSEPKLNSFKSVSRPTPQRNGSSSSLHGRQSHTRWPSPSPCSAPRRSASLGTHYHHHHHGSARTSPYHSPRTSPHGSRRGSRHCSPYTSPYHSPRNSVLGSPPLAGSSSPSATSTATDSVFKYPSPAKSVGVSSSGAMPLAAGSNGNRNSSRTAADVSGSKNRSSSSVRLSPAAKSHPSPPHTSSSSSSTKFTAGPGPARAPDFESGQVLDQLPFEYSSFLDLPPSAFGLSEWEDDRVLAAVLAASQQEYLQGLKQQNSGGGGAESL